MKPIISPQTAVCDLRFSASGGMVLALLLALCFPTQAAPTEGTAGQTVTGRSIHRPDSGARQANGPQVLAAAPAKSKPHWKDLTSAQQKALQPLAPHWDRLNEQRKLKWLVISKNYPSLNPAEQAKLHLRMSNWATLSQQQRSQARQNFKDIKGLSPEQKVSEWEAYQALSPEEKRKLANQARTQPPGVTTVKPGTTPRLSQVPRRSTTARPNLAEASLTVQQNTLLPRPQATRIDSERSPYEDEPAAAQ